MAAFRRKGWPTSVMVLKHGKECRFISDISNFVIVQIVQAANEGLWATEGADEAGLVVGDEEGVLPDTAFECLAGVVLEGADGVGVVVDVTAVEGVLVAPCFVQEFGLKEADLYRHQNRLIPQPHGLAEYLQSQC